MTETELITQLKEFRQIKADKEWAVLAKENILGKEPEETKKVSVFEFLPRLSLPNVRLAFGSVAAFACILGGIFVFAQNALPGDAIFAFKKLSEKGLSLFTAEEETQLQLVNKRLQELTKIAETNQTQKIAPAVQEYQQNAVKAAQNLARTKNPDVKKIAEEVKKLETQKQEIEALGVVVGETVELDNALSQLIENEIKALEGVTLTEEQEQVFAEIKQAFEEGKHDKALENILLLTNEQ